MHIFEKVLSYCFICSHIKLIYIDYLTWLSTAQYFIVLSKKISPPQTMYNMITMPTWCYYKYASIIQSIFLDATMRWNGMKIDYPNTFTMFALHIFLGRVINFKSQIIMRFCCYCGCSCYCFSCHSVFGCLRANKSVAVSRLIYKVSHNHFFSPFCCLIACGIGGKLSTGNRTRIRTEPGLEVGLGLRENVATMTLLSSQLPAHWFC